MQLGECESTFFVLQEECAGLRGAAEAGQRRSDELGLAVERLKGELAEARAQLEQEREQQRAAQDDRDRERDRDMDVTPGTDGSGAQDLTRSDLSRSEHEVTELTRRLDEAHASCQAARNDAAISNRLCEQLEKDVIRLTEQASGLRQQLALTEREGRGAIDGTKPLPGTDAAALQQAAALESSLREAQLTVAAYEQRLREAEVLTQDALDAQEALATLQQDFIDMQAASQEQMRQQQQEHDAEVQGLRAALDEARQAASVVATPNPNPNLGILNHPGDMGGPFGQAVPPATPAPASVMTAAQAKSLFDTPPGQASKRPDNEAANFFAAGTKAEGLFGASNPNPNPNPKAEGLFGAFGADPAANPFESRAPDPNPNLVESRAPDKTQAAQAESVAATAAATAGAALHAQLSESEADKTAAQAALTALQNQYAATLAKKKLQSMAELKSRQEAEAEAEALQQRAVAAAEEGRERERALAAQLAALQVRPSVSALSPAYFLLTLPTSALHCTALHCIFNYSPTAAHDSPPSSPFPHTPPQARLGDRERELAQATETLALKSLRELREVVDQDHSHSPPRATPLDFSSTSPDEHTTPSHSLPAYPYSTQTLDGRGPAHASATMTPSRGSRFNAALGLLGAMSPQQREVGRLNAEIVREVLCHPHLPM